jgi:predicted TPR repeat methyltransferase
VQTAFSDLITTSRKKMRSEKPHSPASTTQRIVLSIDEAFDLGLKLHQGGDLEGAEQLYQGIIASVPDHLDTLHFYGVLCHQQQRQQEAADLIGRIVEIDPDNADAHNNLGNVLEGLGKVADAEACYRKAISLMPDHAPALNNLGVVLMAGKAIDDALDAYARAVELAPETADYRYNLANALRKVGRTADAVAAYRQAVDLDPTHIGAWQGLSRTLLQADRTDEAKQVFDSWLEKDPENSIALYLQAAWLGQGAPGRAPDAYVQKTFDDMADGFDDHLQRTLDYRAPQLLIDALAEILPQPEGSLEIMDAGCGTGLCGPRLKPYARRLVGVDLSAGMLARARGVRAYDELVQGELTAFLQDRTDAYDLIVSADTLCYFGDLAAVMKHAATALKSGGVLAFTVEDGNPAVHGWQLNPHGRYTHADGYVQQVLDDAGLAVQMIQSVLLRREGGQPVNGRLVVAISS